MGQIKKAQCLHARPTPITYLPNQSYLAVLQEPSLKIAPESRAAKTTSVSANSRLSHYFAGAPTLLLMNGLAMMEFTISYCDSLISEPS